MAAKKYNIDIAVAFTVILMVLMFIIPLPTVLLDFFMALNLTFSLVVLLIVLFTARATDFSVFPSLLLLSTIFGLVLNVSSTRLILSKGEAFDGAMIRAFSSFVIGASGSQGLVIGFVIFIILIAVQAFVITKGAKRVAEVSARFKLDSHPTKSMSIDAEYNAGIITDEEARQKKAQLQREDDFYGAMDGANQFVSGNVKVGIFITVINVIAGLIIGMVFRQEPFSNALRTYTTLTIGDGLLAQLPSLFLSVATGLLVTRMIDEGSFGQDIKKQFSQIGWIYFVAAGTLAIMGVLPGFPHVVLFIIAFVLAFVGWRILKAEQLYKQTAKEKQATQKQGGQQRGGSGGEPAQGEIAPIVPLDPLSLELGYALIPLVDKDKGAELLERITRIRREAALDLGLVAPRIRIIDNMRLEPSEYCFKIKGVEVARGKIRMGWYLGINPGGVSEEIPGERTVDPTFGLPAVWISEENRDRAERAGYTVVDPPAIIATHLTEVIKKHAAEILGRQEVQGIMDALRKDYPAVIDEAAKVCSLGEVQKVLQGLLREQVSIRNTIVILETLADFRPITSDVSLLVEKVRQALGRQICLQYADENKTLHVLTIEPSLAQKIVESRIDTVNGPIAALEPSEQRMWIRSLIQAVTTVQKNGFLPIVLAPEASARILIKNSTDREIPDLVVLSIPEISKDIQVEVIGEIKLEQDKN
ncbi:flagellar biosynthesis protein FlhA [Treponema sp. OMZ 906]|jgi:flagellar biosynthesis protein flhA|uniref:flagellar biosynthesis protein FlhA n=1 Tax=Treponema sp. OMZ 906 TaxID=2563662 RepID=UPI0020A4FF67|nr:flagellar biosynthesis protein FlhA [Treponema sp. OMZ 906]UTC56268.1 flagellar biosynthesis protein FlhA [Treponema sp. OMZ 906]